MKQIVAAEKAPKAVGAYSQAVKANGFLFTSGQLGLDPVTGQMVEGGAAAQAAQAMKNLEAVLGEAGRTFGDVVKTTIFLVDMADFAAVNEVYASFFQSDCPARSCVAVKELPKGGQAEIEMVALL